MNIMSLKKGVENYYEHLSSLFGEVQATQRDGSSSNFFTVAESVGQLAIAQTTIGKKIIFIGNGASASISSHMATDYWKNGHMRAIAFNDASLLTCISNDCGFENVFEKPVEMFADEGDILIAISSSGKSGNILNAVRAAQKMGLYVVTLSGFKADNPLRSMGDFNFFVPDEDYGPVEIIHLSILHGTLDSIIELKAQITAK